METYNGVTFRVGDSVKVKSRCSGAVTGKIYRLIENNGELVTIDENCCFLCTCVDNWIKINNKDALRILFNQ